MTSRNTSDKSLDFFNTTRDEVTAPLVVDVDGSLVSGDLSIEGAVQLLRVSPLNIFALPLWLYLALVKGRAVLKRRIARAFVPAPETLLLNPEVLEEIAAAQAAGRPVWLASGSDELAVAPLAERVAATGYFASDGRTNLVGQEKAALLSERFGQRGFDYIGNERRDLAVWREARLSIGVNLPLSLERELRMIDENARLLNAPGGRPSDFWRALRPQRWIKNLLVFAPLLAARETRAESYLEVVMLFMALSICASGTYLLNDLLDLPQDRRHRSKRFRPLAAGKLPLLPAACTGMALVLAGLSLAFWLAAATGFCILAYLLVSFAYSLWFERKTFIDVMALALLDSIRVIAGGIAVSITLSPWFMGFFLFLFLSLALFKRQSELHDLHESGESRLPGGAYLVEDRTVLAAFVAACSIATLVVLGFYIRSPEVSAIFNRAEWLWLVGPLLIYWLGRMSLLANRGIADDDPFLFALSDRTSWFIGVGILAVFIVAL